MKLNVCANVPYIEDAEVNGIEEENESPKMPFMTQSKEYDGEFDWNITIDIESGKIENWPTGTTAKTWYKVCDCCKLFVDGTEIYDDYVPKFLSIYAQGFGDYIYLEILEDGTIKDWNSTECKKFIKNCISKYVEI